MPQWCASTTSPASGALPQDALYAESGDDVFSEGDEHLSSGGRGGKPQRRAGGGMKRAWTAKGRAATMTGRRAEGGAEGEDDEQLDAEYYYDDEALGDGATTTPASTSMSMRTTRV